MLQLYFSTSSRNFFPPTRRGTLPSVCFLVAKSPRRSFYLSLSLRPAYLSALKDPRKVHALEIRGTTCSSLGIDSGVSFARYVEAAWRLLSPTI